MRLLMLIATVWLAGCSSSTYVVHLCPGVANPVGAVSAAAPSVRVFPRADQFQNHTLSASGAQTIRVSDMREYGVELGPYGEIGDASGFVQSTFGLQGSFKSPVRHHKTTGAGPESAVVAGEWEGPEGSFSALLLHVEDGPGHSRALLVRLHRPTSEARLVDVVSSSSTDGTEIVLPLYQTH